MLSTKSARSIVAKAWSPNFNDVDKALARRSAALSDGVSGLRHLLLHRAAAIGEGGGPLSEGFGDGGGPHCLEA